MESYQEKQRVRPLEKEEEITKQKSSYTCPSCGKTNDSGALYCEDCGIALKRNTCPVCKELLESEGDICEKCGAYISKKQCSFCNEEMTEEDAYCPACGCPRAGIICPDCRTHNIFSFCSACGKPLTETARRELTIACREPLYPDMQMLNDELEKLRQLQKQENKKETEVNKYAISDSYKHQEEINEELRKRVVRTLEKKEKLENFVSPSEQQDPKPSFLGKAKSGEELENLIRQKETELQQLLDNMQTPALEFPVQARNYSLARKPQGGLFGWMCNYKHFVHNGPQDCACPQKGGKWVIKKDKPDGK